MTRHYEKTSLFREASEERELTPSRALALGDEVRRELGTIWNLLISPSATKPEKSRAAEILGRWIPILERSRFVAQVDSAPLLARFVRDIPAGHGDLVKVIVRALRACAAARPLGPAVRQVLVVAARRETELGWNALIELAFLALPESLTDFERIMPTTVFSSAEVATRHQRTLLALPFGAREVRRAAFAVFYSQPAEEFADRTLAELDEAPADVWEGVALAALGRPRLQAPFLDALKRRPRPELCEVVEHIAAHGAFAASELAATWLREHQGAPRSRGLPTPLPRPLPWSESERCVLLRLIEGPADTSAKEVFEAGREALTRLVGLETQVAADLIIEVLDRLAVHLAEPRVEALLVEVCCISQQRSVLACAARHLLAHVQERGPLPSRDRMALGGRALSIIETHDAGLALYRLALPTKTDAWVAAVGRVFPVTEVPQDDFLFALALARSDRGPLESLLAALTPNQRRLLIKRAPSEQLSQSLDVLAKALASASLASLPALCERLVEEPSIPGAIEVLRDLTAAGWPEGLRRAAVEALGALGGEAELTHLGQLVGVDTRSARTRIVERLRAGGESLEEGALALSTGEGQLMLAGAVFSKTELEDTPPRPSALPADRRQRLGPPPRGLSPQIVFAHLIISPSIWGTFVANGCAAAWLMGWPIGYRLVMLLAFLLHHVSARTRLLLDLLRRGELLIASVRLHTTRTGGKHPSTTYHHTLTLLADSGRTEEHVLSAGRRKDELLDERLEPVLATRTQGGRKSEVWPVDDLLLVSVSGKGQWRLSGTAWGLLGGSIAAWVLYLVL